METKQPKCIQRDMERAAACGEPSYVWRAGQERRLHMILEAGGERLRGNVVDNGCGVGQYVEHLLPYAGRVYGLEYEFERAREARQRSELILRGAGENLPFPNDSLDVILSHE